PIPWHPGDTCVDVLGDGCLEKICYAWRQTSSNNYDYCVTQICTDGCSGVDDSTMLDSASHWLIKNNPRHFPTDTCSCDTCCGHNIQWNEAFVTCWTICFVHTPYGWGKQYTICPDHGWCVDAYWVCVDRRPPHERRVCYDRSVQTTWQCNNEPVGYQYPCEAPCTKF